MWDKTWNCYCRVFGPLTIASKCRERRYFGAAGQAPTALSQVYGTVRDYFRLSDMSMLFGDFEIFSGVFTNVS